LLTFLARYFAIEVTEKLKFTKKNFILGLSLNLDWTTN